MANKRKFAYRDPNEDEYIFHNLCNYPDWAFQKLTPSETAIFKTHNSIRQFVNNSSADQKKLILAKAGIRFISLYIDENKEKPLNLKDFAKIYKSFASAKERRRLIELIQEGNTFAISSREVANAGYLIAQNCHTAYWTVNHNFKRVYDAVDELRLRGLKSYKPENEETTNIKALESFRDVCANFYLATLGSEYYIPRAHRLDMMDIRMLMYFFIHRDKFIEKKVMHKFMFAYKQNSVSARLFKLVSGGYIDINRSNQRNQSYTIAERGIIVINELLEGVTQKAVVI